MKKDFSRAIFFILTSSNNEEGFFPGNFYNSEANAPELVEIHNEMFHRFYTHNDACNSFKSPTTLDCVPRRKSEILVVSTNLSEIVYLFK